MIPDKKGALLLVLAGLSSCGGKLTAERPMESPKSDGGANVASSAGAGGGAASAAAAIGGAAGRAGGDGGGGASGNGSAGAVRSECRGIVDMVNASACRGIDRLRLSDPKARDYHGDERISPGDRGAIQVLLTNTGDETFTYPCVGWSIDNPGVSILLVYPGFAYNRPPGASETFRADIAFDASIPSNTAVRVTAWVDRVRADCSGGPRIMFDVPLL